MSFNPRIISPDEPDRDPPLSEDLAALAGRMSVEARQLADQFPPPNTSALLRKIERRQRRRDSGWGLRAAGLLLAVSIGSTAWWLSGHGNGNATSPIAANPSAVALADADGKPAFQTEFYDYQAGEMVLTPTVADASAQVFSDLSDSEREGLLDLWEHEPLLASHVSL